MKKLLICLCLFLIGCQDNDRSSDLNGAVENEIPIEDVRLFEDLYFQEGLYDVRKYDQPPEEHHFYDDWTLEEKIAQLFIIDFRVIQGTPTTVFDDTVKDFLNAYPVGGLIFFDENIVNRDQVFALVNQVQTNSEMPLYISVDEEGGLVSRLGKKSLVIHLDKASKLAEKALETVYQDAALLGQDLKALGFNMDFAPVLDVNTNSNNPVIGTRAFSNDPTIVATYGEAFAKGLYDQGIIPVGKHFPGHGDTIGDSHLGAVVATMDMDRFLSIEGYPFDYNIQNGLQGIMVGHIKTPNLTSDGYPASLSSQLVQNLLRDTMGFDGLVITDSFQMQAITDHFSPDQAAVLAVAAGCDLVLMPEDFQLAYEGLITAVENGQIPLSRIHEALNRIYRHKRYLNN